MTPERFIVRKPWRAAALGILPGVGYLYLGLYQRAVVFFGSFILGISIAAEMNTPFLAFALIFLYVFGVLDSYRQAVLLNAGFQPDLGMSWVPFSLGAGQGRRLLGGVLVAGGGLELLSRLNLWQWRWLFDYGFVLAILVGVWLLVSASRRYPSQELAEDTGY